MKIQEVVHSPDKDLQIGAVITELDLDHITDEEVTRLKEAVWKYSIVIVKKQKSWEPKNQWDLVLRLDRDTSPYSQETYMKLYGTDGKNLFNNILSRNIPGAGMVHLIGKGYQGEDHYGLKDVSVIQAGYADYHITNVPEEEFENGHTRFFSWHFDAPLYARDVAMFTVFRAIKLPSGPNQTVHWDDGSGLTTECKPGQTAFVSSTQLYDLLSDEEKLMAENSWVEYVPFSLRFVRSCKAEPHGLCVVSQGKEDENFSDADPDKIKTYPMVWKNPLTGRKAFQVQAFAARKLFIRRNPTDKVEVIDDLPELRKFLYNIQSRIVKPEYVYMAIEEEGDVDNRALLHTAIDYPIKYGSRTMHQANMVASGPPIAVAEFPASSKVQCIYT